MRGWILIRSGRPTAGFGLWHEVLRSGNIPQDPSTCAAPIRLLNLAGPEFSHYVTEVERIRSRWRAQYGAGIVAEAAHPVTP